MLDPKLKPFCDKYIEKVSEDGLFTFYWDGQVEYDDTLPKVIREEDFREMINYIGPKSKEHNLDLLLTSFTPPGTGRRVHAFCLYDRAKFEAEVMADFPQIKVPHKDFMSWWIADRYIQQFGKDTPMQVPPKEQVH